VGTIPDLVSINAQDASVRGAPLLQAFAFPRQDLPEFCRSSRTSDMRGRRECRVRAAPMARLQQGKQAAVTTGSAGTTGIPRAMVYGL
jgi:hypothetical protein